MYATRTCKSSAAMALHIRRKAFSYGYNSLLLKQQYRGITIRKHFVLDRNLNEVRKKDIERSYDLLLSETTSDVQALGEASSSINHQSGGEVNENPEPSKWDSIKQKCDYTSRPLYIYILNLIHSTPLQLIIPQRPQL